MSDDTYAHKVPMWFKIALPALAVLVPISWCAAPISTMTCLLGSTTLLGVYLHTEGRKTEGRLDAAFALINQQQQLRMGLREPPVVVDDDVVA